MQTVSFMKEVFADAYGNVSIVMLNQRQVKAVVDYTVKNFLSDVNTSLIFVSLTQPASEILSLVPDTMQKNMFIIDGFSNTNNLAEKEKNVMYIETPANLTGMQIGIEKATEVLPGKKIIIIDSIGALAANNPKKTLGKFLYIFTNKIKLQERSLIIFATAESIDSASLDLAKQFSDKTYDFSLLYISSIDLA